MRQSTFTKSWLYQIIIENIVILFPSTDFKTAHLRRKIKIIKFNKKLDDIIEYSWIIMVRIDLTDNIEWILFFEMKRGKELKIFLM